MTSRGTALADPGQSVWYDNVAPPALDLDAITEQLERYGFRQFSEASEMMIEAIGAKRQRVGGLIAPPFAH